MDDLTQLCIVCKNRPVATNPKTGKRGKLCAKCALKALAEFCGFEASFLLDRPGEGAEGGLNNAEGGLNNEV